MVRHVVLMLWREETPAATREAARTALAELPGRIPGILRYEIGPDLGLVEGNFDFALVADFADAEAFARYAAHPEHVAVVNRHLKPHLAARAAAQYAIEAPPTSG